MTLTPPCGYPQSYCSPFEKGGARLPGLENQVGVGYNLDYRDTSFGVFPFPITHHFRVTGPSDHWLLGTSRNAILDVLQTQSYIVPITKCPTTNRWSLTLWGFTETGSSRHLLASLLPPCRGRKHAILLDLFFR